MTTLEKQLEASVRMTELYKPQALAVVRPGVLAANSVGTLRFTPEQESMIRDTCANGASPEEFAWLLEVAKLRRLNPLMRQVFFVKRWDTAKNRYVWAVQVSIDGMRAIAERTRLYNGQDEPEFGPVNAKGFPQWAKVRVYRKDWDRPAVGVAYWGEYVQLKDGHPTKFWAGMPFNQLAKCAETQAFRKAFPEDCGGLYTDVEMEQAANAQPIINTRVEQIETTEVVRRPITAHGDDSDEPTAFPPDPEVFERLSESLSTIENSIPMCQDYGSALTLRALLGSKAKQSPLTRDIQRSRESGQLSISQHAELGKAWQRCNRQVEKLEQQFKPDLLASFVDADD